VFGDRRRVAVLTAGLAAALSISGGAVGHDLHSAAPGGTPLLGVNLIQHDFARPYCWGGLIIHDYDLAGVRAEVVPALHAMRAAGLETVRLQIPHRHATDKWIPSAGGRIAEPYRTNLIRLLGDIRRAGMMQVTIQFNPRGPNEPAGWYQEWDPEPYDPAMFEENWGFIRDVRALVKQYGPESSRFDIYGEGAPGEWDLANKPWWGDYVVRLYRNYVDAFGNSDVTISSVAKGMWNFGTPSDDVERMQNLIGLLRASGKPLPTYFAVHPSFAAGAYEDLRAVDDVLRRNGLSQPLVISESAYRSTAVAQAISEFVRTTGRLVPEVIEWPLYTDNVAGQGFTVQPRCPTLPFRADEYATVLRGGAAPRVLRGSVGAKGQPSLSTPFGHEVKALDAGTYTLTIRDTSATHGFQLSGTPDRGRFAARTTGLRFKGTVTWTVKLRAGFYTYAAKGPRTVAKEFPVLSPGG